MSAGGADPVHEATRGDLHRVAAHVLARRRFEVSGRFGLRASPGGFATPAFGAEPEALRVAGVHLVRERGGTWTATALSGATLRTLAEFAGTGIDGEFSAGADTPAILDPDAPLDIDAGAARRLADWYALGWGVLDTVLAELAADAAPATVQLWPEHFDAGTHVGVGAGERVNLGFSPGDAFSAEPYLYVGPWGSARPGDPAYWNAPFGALLRASEVGDAPDAAACCVEFVRSGIRNASGG